MRTLLILFAFLFSIHASALHVVIDAGHGGSDKGATSDNYTESEITLSVAKLLEKALKADSQFKVTMTRKDDTFLSLSERTRIANQAGDVFISIHVNSSSDSRARGNEIYFQNHLAPDEESLFLASRENQDSKPDDNAPRSVTMSTSTKKDLNPEVLSIIEDLERNHRLKLSGIFTEKIYYNWMGDNYHRSRTIRQAPFFVVSNMYKPAALVEIGYITNPGEAEKLMDPSYQKKIATGLYRALISFKEFMDKPTVKSLN